jgi:hypothetical protein
MLATLVIVEMHVDLSEVLETGTEVARRYLTLARGYDSASAKQLRGRRDTLRAWVKSVVPSIQQPDGTGVMLEHVDAMTSASVETAEGGKRREESKLSKNRKVGLREQAVAITTRHFCLTGDLVPRCEDPPKGEGGSALCPLRTAEGESVPFVLNRLFLDQETVREGAGVARKITNVQTALGVALYGCDEPGTATCGGYVPPRKGDPRLTKLSMHRGTFRTVLASKCGGDLYCDVQPMYVSCLRVGVCD